MKPSRTTSHSLAPRSRRRLAAECEPQIDAEFTRIPGSAFVGRQALPLCFLALLSPSLLAEMQLAPTGAASTGAAPTVPAPGSPGPEIRDIIPPIDVFPYPAWMIALAAALTLALLVVLIWRILRWLKNRPGAPALSARALALRELQSLQAQIYAVDSYAFSITITEILRRFVHGHFGLPATRQTSPEFLASLTDSPRFSEDDRTLLGPFLEKCDALKFARLEANAEESTLLFNNAQAFIRGARP